jgi:hypothetical protein
MLKKVSKTSVFWSLTDDGVRMNIRNVGRLNIPSWWSQKEPPQSLTSHHFLMMESEWISETSEYFPFLKEWERVSEVMDFSFYTTEVSETLDVFPQLALLTSRRNFHDNAWQSPWLWHMIAVPLNPYDIDLCSVVTQTHLHFEPT